MRVSDVVVSVIVLDHYRHANPLSVVRSKVKVTKFVQQ